MGRSPIAEEAVRQIALLYGVESTVRGMAPSVRLAARCEVSAPVVTAPNIWFEAQLSRVPMRSQIATDIRYGSTPFVPRPLPTAKDYLLPDFCSGASQDNPGRFSEGLSLRRLQISLAENRERGMDRFACRAKALEEVQLELCSMLELDLEPGGRIPKFGAISVKSFQGEPSERPFIQSARQKGRPSPEAGPGGPD